MIFKSSASSILLKLISCNSMLPPYGKYDEIIKLIKNMLHKHLNEKAEITIYKFDININLLKRYINDILGYTLFSTENNTQNIVETLLLLKLIPYNLLLNESVETYIIKADIEAPKKTKLLLHTHVDTFPLREFTILKKDSYVFGPGAADGKGGLISILIAVEKFLTLVKRAKYGITLVVTTEEERGGLLGLGYALYTKALTLEEYIGCISTTGYIDKAVAGCYGRAWAIIDSAELLGKIRERMHNITEHVKEHSILSYLNVNSMHVISNELNYKKYSVIQFTFLSADTAEFIRSLEDTIKKYINEYSTIIAFPSAIPNIKECNCGFYLKIRENLKSILGKKNFSIASPSDIRHFIYNGIPSIAWGPMTKESYIHTGKENVNIANLILCGKILGNILLNICQ